jgi:hypothetical protein
MDGKRDRCPLNEIAALYLTFSASSLPLHWSASGSGFGSTSIETWSMSTPDSSIHFVPSRVDGLGDVTAVTVYRDRLEITSAGRVLMLPLVSMAKWPRPAWFWRLLFRVGIRPRWLPVGDRDWFHSPSERFFAFYTDPPLVIYMPIDEPADGYAETYFARIQMAMRAGGFNTFDLG